MGRLLDDRLARPAWRRYGAAVVLAALAALLSVVLHSWLDQVPLAPYFTAVAIAAWYGGVGPAATAILLSLAPISLVALEPFGEWSLGRDAGVALVAFIIVSSVFVLLSASRDRAEAATHSARARADALAEATRAVSDAEFSLEGVLTAIAYQASVHVGELAVVRLASADREWLETAAVGHPDPATQQAVKATLVAERHPADRGANGAALREGRPQRLDAATLAAHRAADPDLWAGPTVPETAALLAVPLRANGHNVGTLSVSRARVDQSYTVEDERFLQALADQAALAIERARLFAQIHSDEERLRLAIEANRMVAWEWDPAADTITTGANFPEIYGLPALGGLAEGLALVYPDDLPAHKEKILRIARDGGEYQSIYRITRPTDGNLVWLEERAAALTDESGRITRLVGVVMDVTARLQAEEALRTSETKVRRLFDTGVIGLIIGDGERILEANDRFLQMMHATQDDLRQGRLVWGPMTPPEYAERDAAALAEIAARGFCTPFEKEYVRLDGSRVPILIGAAAVEGTSPPWICAVLDLTTQKAAEIERVAFIDAATHDLRNPLTALKGRSQLLLRRFGRGQVATAADIEAGLTAMIADADRMMVIINELMDAAHLRIGQALDLDLAAADLVALVRGCVANDRHRTSQRVTVESSAPDLCGTWDLPRLERVVQNLLDNAIKYSFGNGDIVLRLDRETDPEGNAWAILSVQDEGIGIPAADLPGIFERFQRGSNVGNTVGTGVGLAGARQIIEQHDGTIAVESVEGHGSTVTVRLPLSPPR